MLRPRHTLNRFTVYRQKTNAASLRPLDTPIYRQKRRGVVKASRHTKHRRVVLARFSLKFYHLPTSRAWKTVKLQRKACKNDAAVFGVTFKVLTNQNTPSRVLSVKEKHGIRGNDTIRHTMLSNFTVYRPKSNRDVFRCVKTFSVLTHQKPPHHFYMLFFDVLPFTTLAVSVNGKTSKKSVQKRRGGVCCV